MKILQNDQLHIMNGRYQPAYFKDLEKQMIVNQIYGHTDHMPIFRGTYGLWHHFPAIKNNRLTYSQIKDIQLFKQSPETFWFVYGHIFNRLLYAEPHSGFEDLKQIIESTGQEILKEPFNNYFIMHQGLDQMYQKTDLAKEDKIFQPRGSLMRWQCKCKTIKSDDYVASYGLIDLDYITGQSITHPGCQKCKSVIRPNIQLKNDLEFLEEIWMKEHEDMEKWLQKNKRRQTVIIEIGASCAQPIVRDMAMEKWLNDKYRCTLIRINPILERQEIYDQEQDAFDAISNQNQNEIRQAQVFSKILEEVRDLQLKKRKLQKEIDQFHQSLDNTLDDVLRRPDSDETLHSREKNNEDTENDHKQRQLNNCLMDIEIKKGLIKSLGNSLKKTKDDIDMNNGEIPRYWEQNTRTPKYTEEDRKIQNCKNDLIEIQIGAKDGLRLLREAVDHELQKKTQKQDKEQN